MGSSKIKGLDYWLSGDFSGSEGTIKNKDASVAPRKSLFIKYRIREPPQFVHDKVIESGSIDVNEENYNEIKLLLHYLEIDSKYNRKDYTELKNFREMALVENLLKGYLKDEGIIPNLKGLLRNLWKYGLTGKSREEGREIIIMDLTKFNSFKKPGEGWPVFGLLIVQTMKSAPNFEIRDGKIVRIGRRGIDKDNTYRYAYFFIGENDRVYLIFNEKYYSSTFRRWLGVIDISSYESLNVHFYLKKSGCQLKFEVDENELMNMRKRKVIQLDPNKNRLGIKEKNHIVWFNIEKIRILPARIDVPNISRLIEILRERRLGIFHLKCTYERILNEDFKGHRNPHRPKYREYKDRIEPIDSKCIFAYPIYKYVDNRFSSTYILFSDFKGIEYDRDFLCDILRKIKDEEYIELIHILLPLEEEDDSKGIEILPYLKIKNQVNLPSTYDFLKKIYEDEEVARSALKDLVKLAILKSLSEIREFKYFIDSLLDENILREVDYKIGGRIGRLEDKFVEYKDAKILYGNPQKVANHLLEKCIKNKLKKGAFKLVIIGYDESRAKVIGIDKGRAGHDHIRQVFEKLRELAKSNNVFVSEPIVVPMDDRGFIIVFYIYSEL